MSRYKALAGYIVQAVGGKANIASVTHCMTRLRLSLHDESLIDEEALNQREDIIACAHAAGKFQVIIGNSVADVFKEVLHQLGGVDAADAPDQHVSLITRITNVIVKVITPTLGCLVAAGLLKGLLALFVACGWITPGDGTYAVLNAVGDSIFYFFPLILGYTSAETFGLSKFIGMVLGGTLLYPALAQTCTTGDPVAVLFEGTAFQAVAYAKFMGIPVLFPAMGYASSVIPIILITLFAAKVEATLKRAIPDIVGFAFVPFLTLLIAAPVGLLVIGPVSNVLQSAISWATSTLMNLSPVVAALAISLIYQPLVIFGLHWPLITLAITNFQAFNYDYLWPMMFTASFAQTAVVVAVMVRTENRKTKAMAIPAIISGLMCIIEPAIYGFSLKDNKRFAFSMIGAAAGGVFITIMNCVQYTLGIGLLGFSGFINPQNGDVRNVVIAAIGVAITMVVSFVLTFIFFRDVDTQEEIARDIAEADSCVLCPVEGELVELSEVADETFSRELLGKTVAINPTKGMVVSPCDGTVVSMFPTGHAVCVNTDAGMNILIHIGIDTVSMDGEGFEALVTEGVRVAQGQPLVAFDIAAIRSAHLDPTVMVTILDSDEYASIKKNDLSHTLELDKLMEVYK